MSKIRYKFDDESEYFEMNDKFKHIKILVSFFFLKQIVLSLKTQNLKCNSLFVLLCVNVIHRKSQILEFYTSSYHFKVIFCHAFNIDILIPD